MRRWRNPVLASLLLLAGAVYAEAPQAKLQQTREALATRQREEARLKKELQAAAGDLRILRERAIGLAADVQRSEARASAAEDRLARIARELAIREAEFAARKTEYAHTLRSLLRMRELPPTAIFTAPEKLEEMLRTGRIMKNTSRALAHRAAALRQDLERLRQLRRAAIASRETVSREQMQLAAKQKQLQAELSSRQRMQQKLDRDHTQAEAEVKRLSRQSASLQELIGKLEQARATPQWAKETTASPKGAMGRARGRLHLPVEGTLLHRFGERKSSNETYRGLVLAPRAHATVVAPYAGEVVFTGPFMDYGRMVLLKHGDGYISLLAGLGSINVTLNQRLAPGEPLGSMGDGRPKLYVELRERSKPIDPARWFAKLPTTTAKR